MGREYDEVLSDPIFNEWSEFIEEIYQEFTHKEQKQTGFDYETNNRDLILSLNPKLTERLFFQKIRNYQKMFKEQLTLISNNEEEEEYYNEEEEECIEELIHTCHYIVGLCLNYCIFLYKKNKTPEEKEKLEKEEYMILPCRFSEIPNVPEEIKDIAIYYIKIMQKYDDFDRFIGPENRVKALEYELSFFNNENHIPQKYEGFYSKLS